VVALSHGVRARHADDEDLRLDAEGLDGQGHRGRPCGDDGDHLVDINQLAGRPHASLGAGLVVDLADAVEHQPLERGGQPCRRLVEEQQPRLDHEGHRYGEHLSLAAREGAGPGAPAGGQGREELDDGARPLPHRGRGRPGADGEVLPHAERRKDVGLLRHVAEPAGDNAPGAGAGDVGATQRDPARPRPHEPSQRLEQGRLPRAVRPDDRDQLARVDAEREPAQDIAVAVARGQVVR
jgi:hypothetical protein